jgi:hypothetical protein
MTEGKLWIRTEKDDEPVDFVDVLVGHGMHSVEPVWFEKKPTAR